MPLLHTLRDGTIWITTVGDVEYQSGLDSLEQALAAARAQDAEARWHIVFDVRESREDRSSDELRGIAHFVADHTPPLSGRCVVLAGDDFHYGLSRMFQAECEMLEIESMVTREPTDVEAWLAEASS